MKDGATLQSHTVRWQGTTMKFLSVLKIQMQYTKEAWGTRGNKESTERQIYCCGV